MPLYQSSFRGAERAGCEPAPTASGDDLPLESFLMLASLL